MRSNVNVSVNFGVAILDTNKSEIVFDSTRADYGINLADVYCRLVYRCARRAREAGMLFISQYILVGEIKLVEVVSFPSWVHMSSYSSRGSLIRVDITSHGS